MRRLIAFVVLVTSWPTLVNAQDVSERHAEEMKASRALFEKSIRPALVKRCLECHGGDKTRGGFSLANRELLLKGGESGAVVDLKSPEDSLLLQLVVDGDMPPKGDKLPQPLIADLGKWIRLGAAFDQPLVDGDTSPKPLRVSSKDRSFWAFRPLADAAPPQMRDPWVRTDIDRFVLTKLRTLEIEPNAAADKRTLARRAALDLIGMPPAPDLLQAFLTDESPDAWTTYIDSLLASNDYGPRWARHWMDVARFAESSGFEHDSDRASAYHYRDFLIQAFNRDLPWNTFVAWQLAGDELAPEEPLAQMATGFMTAGVFPTQLTENEFESARYDEIDDMLNTTGMAFLGLTIGCARCHDHKFDPIPTRDYYRLAAAFARTIRSERKVEFPSPDFEQKLAAWREEATQREQATADHRTRVVEPAFEEWLKSPEIPEQTSTWSVLTAQKLTAAGATLKQQPDGSILASGKNPAADDYTIVAELAANAAALRLEVLTDDSLPRRGPGRAGNGNFQLSSIRVATQRPGAKPQPVELLDPRATHEQNQGNLSLKSSLDVDQGNTGWAVDRGGIGKDNAAVFRFDSVLESGAKLIVRLGFHGNGQHNLGRFRLSVARDPDADFDLGGGADQQLVAAFEQLNAEKPLNAPQRESLFDWFAQQDAKYGNLRAAVSKHQAERPKALVKTVMVGSEGVRPIKHHADGRGYPHFYPEVHYLEGGDVKRKGDRAEPGFLTVLTAVDRKESAWNADRDASPAATSLRRSALVNWLTDTEHGAGILLARVVVNRVWQHHFGRGIVATPNDFGLQGEAPTHPELLDWLARDFIANGWRLKRLHRLIMNSAVYRQSSKSDEKRSRVDVDNQFLWRFTPRRLEAEAIRDSLLSVSATLDPTPFGPGSRDANMRRRSIYFTIKRSAPPNAMIVFDWPEHLVSIGRRASTTIAPQALHFMNSPRVRHYAEGLAKRSGEGALETKLHRVYELALGREPSEQELATATEFIATQTRLYAKQQSPEGAALADFCQAILASNEFLYIP